MTKQILCGLEARQKLKQGAEKVANSVKITLGPKGRNVVLDIKYTTPLITNDGVTIAKEIELEDPFESIGANLIKEVSIKTNDVAGDGTTTACVLANAIVQEGFKNIASGANPIILRKGIDKAIKTVTARLKELSKPISSNTEIEQIASISAGNEEIGKLIATAFEKVGKDGVITIEESKTAQTNLKVAQGIEFDKGFISPYMANANSQTTILENAFILVTDKKLSNLGELLPIFEKIIQASKPLLIIAEDVEGEVLSTLVLNNLRGTFNAVAVKCPAFGDKQKEFLEDICLLTSAKFISKDLPQDLKTLELDDLRTANKIKITKDKTTIIEGHADAEKIAEKREELHKINIDELDNFDRIKLEDRLARLSDGVAVIEVGAPSEIEMHEKKLRIEDALSATKSATLEGIVSGGGTALVQCKSSLDSLINSLDGDEKTGAKIIQNILDAPLRQIAENSGEDSGVIVAKVLEKASENIGFNAASGTFVNMIESGIIDPTKVTRSAIENAGSVASSILTTDVIVAELPQNQANQTMN